jgi:hypothetical protein
MTLKIVVNYFHLYYSQKILIYFIVTICLKVINEVIQTEINKVAEWLNVNKLSLNITKTKFILFRSANKNQSMMLKLP